MSRQNDGDVAVATRPERHVCVDCTGRRGDRVSGPPVVCETIGFGIGADLARVDAVSADDLSDVVDERDNTDGDYGDQRDGSGDLDWRSRRQVAKCWDAPGDNDKS